MLVSWFFTDVLSVRGYARVCVHVHVGLHTVWAVDVLGAGCALHIYMFQGEWGGYVGFRVVRIYRYTCMYIHGHTHTHMNVCT